MILYLILMLLSTKRWTQKTCKIWVEWDSKLSLITSLNKFKRQFQKTLDLPFFYDSGLCYLSNTLFFLYIRRTKYISMKPIALFIVLSLGLLFISCSDSNELKEGMIRYELSLGKAENDSLSNKKGAIDMFSEFEMNVYFKKGKTLVESNMMGGGMNFKVLYDPENQDTLVYLEMMGNKYKTKNASLSSNADNVVITNVEIYENERKDIAGYDAYKVVSSMEVDGKEMNSVAYITEEFFFDGKINTGMIQSEQALFDTEDLLGIKGTILEQMITTKSIIGSIPVRILAAEISTTIDDKVFDINDEEYNPLPTDAFSNGSFPGF